jgi:hypothetical protein
LDICDEPNDIIEDESVEIDEDVSEEAVDEWSEIIDMRDAMENDDARTTRRMDLLQRMTLDVPPEVTEQMERMRRLIQGDDDE